MAGTDLANTILYTVNHLLQQEKYKAALAVVKGFRNGAVWVVEVDLHGSNVAQWCGAVREGVNTQV